MRLRSGGRFASSGSPDGRPAARRPSFRDRAVTALPDKAPVLRVVPMPADTNQHGDIFGGWIMSQMDIAGGIRAHEVAQGPVVTIAVDSMKFIKPVQVGDVVCCYGSVVRLGTTSVTLKLEVWVRPRGSHGSGSDPRFRVTEAAFTFVAIDEAGAKRAIPRD